MADDVVIRAEGLGKKYVIGHRSERERYVALRDIVARYAKNLKRKAADLASGRLPSGEQAEEFWALKNVSFEVKRGEVLGIIGRNGAGKSTLLKVLSRITEPSEGRIEIKGRVASLLEVGTGFHPELTGRENIYLNGAILGMSRAEICRKFDQIVAFAEVEKFLDTPVKRYSSGMYVRLAFAVAAHLDPEILVVDEVLAVGDAEFQRKCLGKMSEVAGGGRTVLFVTHNIGLVTSLCPSAMWLDQGSVRMRNTARNVASEYLLAGLKSSTNNVQLERSQRANASEDNRIRLMSLEWISGYPLHHAEPLRARIQLQVRAPVLEVSVGIGFSNFEGYRLLTYETDFQPGPRPNLMAPGTYTVEVVIDELPLAPDIYKLDVGCRSGDFCGLDYVGDCAEVEVIAGTKTPATVIRKGAGVRLASEWSWPK